MKPWHTKKLNQRHMLVYQLHSCGYTNNEIADIIGYTKAWVSSILNDPRAEEYIQEFATRVAEKVEDVGVKLRLVAPEALDTVVNVMRTSENERVVSANAFGLLDRAGYGKIDRSVNLNAQLSEKQTERLANALREGQAVTREIIYEAEDDADGS